MAFNIPPLPNARLFDENRLPTTTMQVYWQRLTEALSGAINTLANVTGTVLPGYEESIKGAQQAADKANLAADNANKAAASASREAENANMAAQGAQDQSAQNAKQQALINSYIDPDSVLSATPTLITIANHIRHYADGTQVNVSGGTVSATGAGDVNYVYYSDPAFAGGMVTYQNSTQQPSQTGSTHVVGAITIPTAGRQNGGAGPQRPGQVYPQE